MPIDESFELDLVCQKYFCLKLFYYIKMEFFDVNFHDNNINNNFDDYKSLYILDSNL